MSGSFQYRARDLLVGRKTVIDSVVGPVVFVGLDAWLGLPAAVAGSLGLSVLVVVVRLVRHERLLYAVSGLGGVAVGVVIALWSGQAEGFFLPGIVTSALLGVACVASILVRGGRSAGTGRTGCVRPTARSPGRGRCSTSPSRGPSPARGPWRPWLARVRACGHRLLAPEPAPRGTLAFPGGIVVGGAMVFVADTGHRQVVACTPGGGEVTRFGSGRPGLLDGPAAQARLSHPTGSWSVTGASTSPTRATTASSRWIPPTAPPRSGWAIGSNLNYAFRPNTANPAQCRQSGQAGG